MKTYAIVNEKGGVGKTTTSAAIGEGLALSGRKVLFVDLDGQGNLTYIMRAEQLPQNNAYGILAGPGRTRQSVQHTARGDVIGSYPGLAFADSVMTGHRREYRLRDALEAVSGDYDACIIDCPPALGILTINALTAADYAVIPALADAFSLYGLGQIKGAIDGVREFNPGLRVDGILLTRYNGRQVLARSVENAMQKKAAEMGGRIYKTRIRECIALREAQMKRESIYKYAPKSNGAKDYAALLKEMQT